MINIDKNIPVPEGRKKGRRVAYPFEQMEVGDSFVIPDGEREKCRMAAYAWGKRRNLRFVVRLDDDGDVRCWRSE